MENVGLKEVIAVAVVGYAFAQTTKRIAALNDNPMLTRTMLYTLGYLIATHRPAGGYALLK
jgi:hypothetical protein